MNTSRRILVVDDNPVNLEVFHEILDGDYLVDTASNGPAALRLAQQHHPPIVLLDVMLPGIDGYEICRRLRRLPGMSSARIIMVSAKAMPSERDAGFNAGADAYISKPFDETELLEALREPLLK